MEVRLPDPGDALTGVDMFAGLEPDVRQRVIAAAVPRTYRKGQLLVVGDRHEVHLGRRVIQSSGHLVGCGGRGLLAPNAGSGGGDCFRRLSQRCRNVVRRDTRSELQ